MYRINRSKNTIKNNPKTVFLSEPQRIERDYIGGEDLGNNTEEFCSFFRKRDYLNIENKLDNNKLQVE